MKGTTGLAVSIILALGACGGSQSSSDQGSTTASDETTSAAPVSLEPLCITSRTRERECQAEFLPALVALRVRLDVPSGIAARDASEGRDALLAQASAEFPEHSTDEAIAQECTHMREVPADEADTWRGLLEPCTQAADCAAFVECNMHFHEQRMHNELHQ